MISGLQSWQLAWAWGSVLGIGVGVAWWVKLGVGWLGKQEGRDRSKSWNAGRPK